MSTEKNDIESVIAEAVKAKVQVMMVDALGDPAALVRNLVAEALTTKVENRSTYKQEPLITKIIRECIKEEAEKAMRDWITEQRPAIQKELSRRLVADKTEIAQALVDSLTKTAASPYRLQVLFRTDKGDE